MASAAADTRGLTVADQYIEFTVADTAPVLQRGATGDWVFYLKQMLEHNGISPGAINASFDANTEKAVRQYQERYMVGEVTAGRYGVVDKKTWTSLLGRAEALEQGDDALGGVVMGHAAHAKQEQKERDLDPGLQVGRPGWARVDLHLSVHDCYGVPVPEALTYARFMDKNDSSVSDEDSRVLDGRLMFNDIWVPRSGWFYLWVDSYQPTPNHGIVGRIEGVASLECTSATLVFQARQNKGEQIWVSESEAHTRGWNTSWSVESGGTIPWVGGPSFGSGKTEESVDQTTKEVGKTLTFTFPGAGFEHFAQEG